ncbi:MAG TPA: hypothetical protein VE861_10875 [Gemmatimonadaceae bacterium]|nr:hypothetical protein [Gemmatimonadaceae bacterium]
MHPELFELKALVAGRLDAHRRREIDDHLGSCADCSRHYVALMLGSASPKTAEAEARQALVPAGGALTFAGGAGMSDIAPAYGIDAPIQPRVSSTPAVEREPMAIRTGPATFGSLTDAIAHLRADAEAPVAETKPAVTITSAAAAPPAAAQAPAAPLADNFETLSPSIYAPTPYAGVPMIQAIGEPLGDASNFGSMPGIGAMEPMYELPSLDGTSPLSAPESFAPVDSFAVDSFAVDSFAPAETFAPAPPHPTPQPVVPEHAAPSGEVPLFVASVAPVESAPRVVSERPAFVTRPPSVSPAREAAQPELVVTFSSTPPRTPSYRSPTTLAAVAPEQEYVSQAFATTSAAPAMRVEPVARARPAQRRKQFMIGGIAAAAALVLVVAFSGVRFFQSSVSEAAAAAAAAAAKEVAARAAAAPAPVAKGAAAPVQTRIVYVDRPVKSGSGSSQTPTILSGPSTPPAPVVPVTITLPDVNVSTGGDQAAQVNTQRSATTELTRSARATASRTAAPRP